MPADFFAWLQATTVATTIANSTPLTAGLSAVHLVGFALLMGGALLSSLRMAGAFLADRPVIDITGSADRGVALGLGISVTTGILLFSARASGAAQNSLFQLKMCVLVVAAAFHFTVHRRRTRRASASPGLLRAIGVTGLTLWIGVALAACAFIFLE
jgi:hypothetical protein